MPYIHITWAQWRNQLADDYDRRKKKKGSWPPRLGLEYADYVMQDIHRDMPIGARVLSWNRKSND